MLPTPDDTQCSACKASPPESGSPAQSAHKSEGVTSTAELLLDPLNPWPHHKPQQLNDPLKPLAP
jgi:hypothetical protein